MLRPSYSICVLSAYTSTPIVCCLRLSEVARNIFSHRPEERRGIFQQSSSPKASQPVYVEADTCLCVHTAGGVAAKRCLFICQVPDKELSRQVRAGGGGFLFTVLTCPVYAQRLMLFANHTL